MNVKNILNLFFTGFMVLSFTVVCQANEKSYSSLEQSNLNKAHISGGREGLFSLFLSRYKEHPKLSMSIKRSASEGDLVWLHLHVKRTPDSLGAALIHIFRMKDGMVVEHWGVGQPVPEKPKNNNTMF
jgi:predicted SnoaL-like aldol condensation-catalyzing enzyme